MEVNSSRENPKHHNPKIIYMCVWNVFYTHIQRTSNKTSVTAVKPACADPSWVGWPGKRVGILTGREEPLASQLPMPSFSGLLEIRESPNGLALKGTGLGN